MAVKSNAVVISSLFGIGTAVPVLAFAFILAFAAHYIGAAFNKLKVIEKWVRRITAVVMVVIGIYLILRHNVGINF